MKLLLLTVFRMFSLVIQRIFNMYCKIRSCNEIFHYDYFFNSIENDSILEVQQHEQKLTLKWCGRFCFTIWIDAKITLNYVDTQIWPRMKTFVLQWNRLSYLSISKEENSRLPTCLKCPKFPILVRNFLEDVT